jgi:molybdate transport system substrate-binding protein
MKAKGWIAVALAVVASTGSADSSSTHRDAALAPPARARQVTATIRVFAAASLTDVVQALASGFPDARVEPSFGASSALARQIRDGAPADVFLSASPDWLDFLRQAGALAGEPIVLARNRLVCIAPKASPLAAQGVSDPPALLRRIGADGRVAIADEGVPAGEYARAVLGHLGLLDAYTPHLVGQADVRAVLHAVEVGELEAGFVYSTDAKVADVAVLFTFDPASHPPIEYQAAVPRGALNPAAGRRFLDYLRGKAAQKILVDAGFALP